MADSIGDISTVGLPVYSGLSPQDSLLGGAQNAGELAGWYRDASATVLNLATPDAELIRFFSEQYATASPAKQAALQQLADMRSRSAAALTQLIRLIGESARQIISNIR